MKLKTNTVKNWWNVVSASEKTPTITYRFQVQAESEDCARLASESKLPNGFVIQSIEQADGENTPVDISEMERV